MKKERRSRSAELKEEVETVTSGSPDTNRGGLTRNGYPENQINGGTGEPSHNGRGRYQLGPLSPRGKPARGGTDERRTQSERRASSRERRPAWGRPINVHVRVTWETVLEVRRKVKAFMRENYKQRSNIDFVACAKCLEEEILPDWGMSGTGAQIKDDKTNSGASRGRSAKVLRDYDEFLNLTLRKEVDEAVMRSEDYMELLTIAARARNFDIMIPDCRRKLQACYDMHAKPHLVSLKHVVSSSSNNVSSVDKNNKNNSDNNNEFHSVETYDKASTQHSENCQQKLDSVQETYKSYKTNLRPFVTYVKNGDSQSALMERYCVELLEICKILEGWAAEDDGYPDKLEQEMDQKKKEREEHQDALRKIKEDKEEKKEQIVRLKRREGKAAQRYHEYRNSKEKLLERLAELRERDIMLEERIQRKREEREQVRDSREDSGDQSPRRSIEVTERLEMLDQRIEKMERERKIARKQIKRVEQDVKPTSDRTYENKVEMVTFRHQKEDVEKAISKLDTDVITHREAIARIDEQREILTHIRELKISPEAYRKCLRQMRKQEASKADGSQALTSACQQAAPSLGKHWQKLYFLLPFDPPRDLEKRHRDVITIDTLSSRNDLTAKEAALRSLEKWRTFHRRGVVTDLTQALRDIRKGALASKIEKSFKAKG